MVITRDALRQRLAVATKAPQACVRGDEGAVDPARARAHRRTPAAVLIGLVARAEGPAVLLTERTEHLRDHAGQVSFPGGRIEAKDASAAAAALREAEEEIGLAPARVEVLGELAPYDTITGFRVHPVVGWIEPPLALRLDRFEVADAFEVPLRLVLDPARQQRQSYRRGPLTRAYYVIAYPGHFIWGATAGILVNLSHVLRA